MSNIEIIMINILANNLIDQLFFISSLFIRCNLNDFLTAQNWKWKQRIKFQLVVTTLLTPRFLNAFCLPRLL